MFLSSVFLFAFVKLNEVVFDVKSRQDQVNFWTRLAGCWRRHECANITYGVIGIRQNVINMGGTRAGLLAVG